MPQAESVVAEIATNVAFNEGLLRNILDLTDWQQLELVTGVVEVDDLTARRWCANENMQRSDLSDIEVITAIVEIIDAELIEQPDYLEFGKTAYERVKFLLGKMDSDRRNETDYFTNKFIGKVKAVFLALPKPKDWQSFFMNDLPILKIADKVIDVAVANKLNASQTKSLGD
jgi:hypothetical protein